MLNKDNIRELCYVTKIDEIRPIPGRDRVECAVVRGWTIMARKGQFKAGDLGIYFEIDSKTPETEPFEFLAPKKYKIKTQKYKTPEGQFWSQGLLMSADDFGWKFEPHGNFAGDDVPLLMTNDKAHPWFAEGDFLTQYLGVTYAVEEDNKRKAASNPDAKINAALNRHPHIAKKWGKAIKKHKFLRWLFLLFYGRKKDVWNWPSWVVKTDEERVQNEPWVLKDKSEWYATEKVDGTSTSFTLKRRGHRKPEYYVCSRNVVFDTPEKADRCFYETNVYLEMSEKYDVERVLNDILKRKDDLEFVTLQCETFGQSIQKRDYGMDHHEMRAFNLIFGYKDGFRQRLNPREMTDFLEEYNIPCVPIVDEHFVLPDTVEELLEIATGKSAIDGGMREGLVFRSVDGVQSFKAVSNEFLLKYHQ